MNEQDDRVETSGVPATDESADDSHAADTHQEIIVMRAGGRVFAVFADEADNVTEGLRPTPLPHAPPAVLGVVCVRGRMRTVLDPCALLAEDLPAETPDADDDAHDSRRFFVSLSGDEQLALAVERVERIVEIAVEAVEASADFTMSAVRGVLMQDNAAIPILDPARMFETAMHGTERRRPRLKQ